MSSLSPSDTSSLIRHVRIALITGEDNQIVDWFNNLWYQLTIVETPIYHSRGCEVIYYKYEGNKKVCVFYQDNSNDDFWCSYDHYWNKFPMGDYFDISIITKILVENALQDMGIPREIGSPEYSTFDHGSPVEKAVRIL